MCFLHNPLTGESLLYNCFYSRKPLVNQGISPQTPISLCAYAPGTRWASVIVAFCQWWQGEIKARCTRWQRCLVLPPFCSRKAGLFKNNIQYAHSYVRLFVYESIYNASISSYSSALIIDSVRSWVGKCSLYLIARRAQAGGVTLGREQAKWSHAQWYYWCTILYCFLSPLPSHPAKSL